MTLKWRYSQNCAKIHPNELWSVWITMVVLVFWLVWSSMTNFEFEKFLSNGFFSEFVSKFQTCFSYLYRSCSVTSYMSKWSSWFALFTVWRNLGGTWWQYPFFIIFFCICDVIGKKVRLKKLRNFFVDCFVEGEHFSKNGNFEFRN